MRLVLQLWRLTRPGQWVKNGFVFIGVLFGDAWHQPQMVVRALMAAAAFSLVASGTYVMNDLYDRQHDINHPQKRERPLAAKAVSVGSAALLLVILWLGGLALGLLVSTIVLGILLVYILINIAYSAGLKHVVLLDVFIISGGFILRILAGTSGLGIAPSQWLILCGLMVALFLGFAKRRAELGASAGGSVGHRQVLENYQPVLLDTMIVVTATCVIITYSLYTMSPVTIQTHRTEALMYTVPFVMYGIFRYLYLLHNHKTGTNPAQEIFRDLHLLAAITGWLLLTLWLIS